MTGPMPEFLDCTIRDGNYAVNFKFTLSDTHALTSRLSDVGFKWIEVGHGLGLGAAEAGQGDMPSSEFEMIATAKNAAGNAKIGTFCIPGIASIDQLRSSREAGADFIRIGCELNRIESALPFLEEANRQGLYPFLNLMKSYAVSPVEFAKVALDGERAGAKAVYCVDSAGGMMPSQVSAYFDAMGERLTCARGFHGHNNLQLAAINCLTAYQMGAQFLDVTLCGLGRSAGNAPSEITIPLFERNGIDTGMDAFSVMDVAETYMWPMTSRIRVNDMDSIAMGYSLFHSAYMPVVKAAARTHNADSRRLLAAAAARDMTSIDADWLQEEAVRIKNTDQRSVKSGLVDFQSSVLKRDRINSSLEAVEQLVAGMEETASKNPNIKAVLHLVPLSSSQSRMAIPEFVLQDHSIILGRITYGNEQLLAELAETWKGRISAVFLEESASAELFKELSHTLGSSVLFPIRHRQLKKQFFREYMAMMAMRYGNADVLLYGAHPLAIEALNENFPYQHCYVHGHGFASGGINVAAVTSLKDCLDMQLTFDSIIVAAPIAEEDIHLLPSLSKPNGKMIDIQPLPSRSLKKIASGQTLHLDLELAFSGAVARNQAFNEIERSRDQ